MTRTPTISIDDRGTIQEFFYPRRKWLECLVVTGDLSGIEFALEGLFQGCVALTELDSTHAPRRNRDQHFSQAGGQDGKANADSLALALEIRGRHAQLRL